MAQRSPYNDRYKTDQKGKTRKSAAGAKPKRAVADLTPASSAKAPVKKKGLFSRAQASSRAAAPSKPAMAPSSPRMKQLRLIWWVLWVIALGDALGILYLQKGGAAFSAFVPYGWGIWLAAMGGAFFLEFGPIRKERGAMIDAMAAAKGKGGKAAKAAAKAEASKKSDAPEPPAPDDRQPPSAGDA